MTKSPKGLLLSALLACMALTFTGCLDEESTLGVNLVDGSLVYNGQTATLTADRAMSVRDDSLLTTNYVYAVLGNYTDATYGHVSSTYYTQIALPVGSPDINLSEVVVDSVVLSLRKESLYPDTAGTYNFHFEVMQLAVPLPQDTLFYCSDTLPVDPAALYFDDDVVVRPTDTIVRLKLSTSITSVLTHMATADEFLQITKGLRIRTTDAGDEGMLAMALASNDSRITVHYRSSVEDAAGSQYQFPLGGTARHFTHFEHDYSTSPTQGSDSLPGGQLLYLEPLGGYNVLLSFDSAIRAFHAAHPLATVHHAELLLPVAAGADAMRPERIMALDAADSVARYIPDLIDGYTMAGYDGKYDEARRCYRLRVTQHVQDMLRKGCDTGTLLVLNARRYQAARTLLSGLDAATALRIDIVFTE